MQAVSVRIPRRSAAPRPPSASRLRDFSRHECIVTPNVPARWAIMVSTVTTHQTPSYMQVVRSRPRPPRASSGRPEYGLGDPFAATSIRFRPTPATAASSASGAGIDRSASQSPDSAQMPADRRSRTNFRCMIQFGGGKAGERFAEHVRRLHDLERAGRCRRNGVGWVERDQLSHVTADSWRKRSSSGCTSTRSRAARRFNTGR